jgi:hypothetical protein
LGLHRILFSAPSEPKSVAEGWSATGNRGSPIKRVGSSGNEVWFRNLPDPDTMVRRGVGEPPLRGTTRFRSPPSLKVFSLLNMAKSRIASEDRGVRESSLRLNGRTKGVTFSMLSVEVRSVGDEITKRQGSGQLFTYARELQWQRTEAPSSPRGGAGLEEREGRWAQCGKDSHGNSMMYPHAPSVFRSCGTEVQI